MFKNDYELLLSKLEIANDRLLIMGPKEKDFSNTMKPHKDFSKNFTKKGRSETPI